MLREFGLLVLALCWLTAAHGSSTVLFDIPEQRADLALTEFAQQAGISVLFPFDEISQVTANRLVGEYGVEEGLTELLRGTGLTTTIEERRQFVVHIADPGARDEPEAGGIGVDSGARGKRGLAAVLGAILGGASGAQDVQAQRAQDEQTPAQLEEIIVTATKRELSLRDVSAPVSAFDQDRLVNAQISTLEDLQAIAPVITITSDFNLAKLFIRGIGLSGSFSGSDPAVPLHVDGVVISRPEAQLGSMFDLQRVEVLRGPQGTLYGRNAVGGSVNLVTAKPTDEVEGYARLTVGNYDTTDVEGAVGGALVEDRLLGRVAFMSQNRSEGFGMNPVTGNYVDDRKRTMGRVHLQFLPGDNVDFLLTGEWFNQDDNSGALKYSEPTLPNIPGFEPVGAGGFAADRRDLASDVDPGTETESWAVTGTTTWDVTNNLSIVNVTSFRDFSTTIVQDLDASAVKNSLATNGRGGTIQSRNVFSEQLSTELRFQYDNDVTSTVAGVFYLNEDFGSKRNSFGVNPAMGEPLNLVALNNAGVDPWAVAQRCNLEHRLDSPAPIIPAFCARGDLSSEALGVFGQTVVHISRMLSGRDNLSLKFGARYSDEDRFVSNPTTIILGNGQGAVFQADEYTSRNEKSFDSLDPEFGIEWRPTDSLLVYATYSEAFKSGTGQVTLSGVDDIVDPETITNREFGLRSDWMNGRLTTDVNAFSYDLKNQQVSRAFFDTNSQTLQSLLENASAGEAKGVEFEISGVPSDRLRLSASVAWLDATFKDFETIDTLDIRNTPGPRVDPSVPAFDPQVLQLAGNRLRNSPEWSSNFNVVFDIGAVRGGDLSVATDISYKSDVFFTEFNNMRQGAEANTMVNASLDYTSASGQWSVSLWAQNLTDELVKAGSFPITGNIIGVQYLPPRTYGMTFGYRL